MKIDNNDILEQDKELKDIDDLIDSLEVAVNKISEDEDVRRYMQSVYSEKDMAFRRVNEILKGRILLQTLNEVELGIWCVYLYKKTKIESINPTDYFTDLKIESIKQYYNVNAETIKTNEIILENVIKVKNQYLCPFISYYDIAKYMENGLIGYNTKTQRDPKVTNVGGKLIVKPNINWKSVYEISNIIYQDKFTANLLTFNVLKTSNFIQDDIIKYDEEEKTLRILTSVDVTDGFHRVLGTLDAVKKANENNEKLEYGFMLSVTNFSLREAQDYIAREDKRNPINKDYRKSLEKNDCKLFIDKLNETGETSTNEMKNKISNSIDEVLLGNEKYVTSHILDNAFKISGLDFSKPHRNDKYLEHFIFVFNTIIGEFLDKYDYDINKLKESSVALQPNIFIGYVAIGKQLLGNSNKKEILSNLVKYLDLSRDQDIWKEIDLLRKNPKSYKKIYEYFDNIIKEVV